MNEHIINILQITVHVKNEGISELAFPLHPHENRLHFTPDRSTFLVFPFGAERFSSLLCSEDPSRHILLDHFMENIGGDVVTDHDLVPDSSIITSRAASTSPARASSISLRIRRVWESERVESRPKRVVRRIWSASIFDTSTSTCSRMLLPSQRCRATMTFRHSSDPTRSGLWDVTMNWSRGNCSASRGSSYICHSGWICRSASSIITMPWFLRSIFPLGHVMQTW